MPKAKKPQKKSKPSVKKIKKTPEKPKIKGKLIGKVTHYFSNIEVAVINLSGPLGIGDEIRITGGENTDFNQKVKSMQVDHKDVKKAKKGESVGMKVSEQVRDNYNVYKV